MQFARDLGEFLRCLHGLSLPELGGLPFDPVGRADMSARVPATRIALEELDRSGETSDRAAEILAEAEMVALSQEGVLVHGDLHVRHALISSAGRLSGVIDWGDICRAPAAVDLSLFWSLFSPAAREVFRDAYGPLSHTTLLIARVLALFLNAVLAAYARDLRIPSLEAEARSGVERALSD